MINKVTLVGVSVTDADMNQLPSGGVVTNLRVVTTRSFRNKKTGEKQKENEYHRIVVYNKLAEIIGKNVKQGASLYIEARIKGRKFIDKDSKDCYVTELIASEVQMLDKRGKSAPSGGYSNPDQDAQQMGNVGIPVQDDGFDD